MREEGRDRERGEKKRERGWGGEREREGERKRDREREGGRKRGEEVARREGIKCLREGWREKVGVEVRREGSYA